MSTTSLPKPTVRTTTAGKKIRKTKPVDAWFYFGAASTFLLWRAAWDIHDILHEGGSYRELGSFFISGLAASKHLDPYRIYPGIAAVHPFPRLPSFVDYDVNLNPPSLLPMLEAFSHLDLRHGVVLWTLISVLGFICGTASLIQQMRGHVQVRVVTWLLLSAAVFDTLWLGQDYALMYVLACMVFLLTMAEREIGASVCIGILVALRPNLGLWPIMLFVAGYRRAAITSTLTAVAMSVFPLLRYGPTVYSRWLQALSDSDKSIYPTNISITGVITRLGYPSSGKLLAVVLALALIIFISRVKPPVVDVGGIAVCAGILCSPIGWFEYLTFVAPLVAASRRFGRIETYAVVLSLLPDVTGLVTGANRPLQLLASLPYFAALCLILISFLRSSLEVNPSRNGV